MSASGRQTILVATDEGLHIVKDEGATRVDDLAWCVFLSRDAGLRWDAIAKGLAPVRAVALG